MTIMTLMYYIILHKFMKRVKQVRSGRSRTDTGNKVLLEPFM